MDDVTVFGIPGSPFVGSALWLLAERCVPCVFSPLEHSDLNGADHIARKPFGRVPVIVHGDFVLYETQAILRYVAEYFQARPWNPNHHVIERA